MSLKVENSLEQIERNYPVAEVVTNSGLPVWPIIRLSVFYAILQKEVQFSSKLRTRNKWRLLKNLFYGCRHWLSLKKFDYVLFNITEKRVPLNHKLYDIYADAWADRLGQDRSIFIEWATYRHLPENRIHSKNVLSDLGIKLLAQFYSIPISEQIVNRSIIDQICDDFGIQINVEAIVKKQLAEAKAYRCLFKKINPKGVFILSGFTNVMIVYAAKQLKIPVYEMQHGFIGSRHPFYTIVTQFKEFYPDYLLSFGSSEKKQDYPHFIFEKERIIPVGSLQIELAKERPVPTILEQLKEQYRLIFCVTLQVIKDDEMLNWILKEALLHKDWCFVVRPKEPNFDLSAYKDTPNIIMFPEISTYDVLKICDFNISIFSTTIVEGVFFGTKPILYNVFNLPKKYFDFEKETIALIEPGELITAIDLEKPGIFDPPYFLEEYLENVKKAPLFF